MVDLCKLGDELPLATTQVFENRLSLRLKFEGGMTRLIGTDTQIGDEFSLI
jgi:hypothetical protein